MPVGEKIGIQCEMGATWSSGAPGNVSVLKSTDLSLYCFPGLFLLTLGAAEMSSFSCRVHAVAVMEKTQTSRKFVHIMVKSRECSWGKAGRSEGNCAPLTSQGSCWIWWLLLGPAPGPSIPINLSLHPEQPHILGRSFNNQNIFLGAFLAQPMGSECGC